MGDYPEDGLEGLENENWQESENECYYGCEFCADPFLRDNCGCVGCFVQAIPEESKPPTCPHCDIPMDREDEEINGEPTYTCKKCRKIIKCSYDYIMKLWEDLTGPKPLGLVDKINTLNVPDSIKGDEK